MNISLLKKSRYAQHDFNVNSKVVAYGLVG